MLCVNSAPLPFTRSCLACCWRQDRAGFSCDSLKAIKEQHTDRMRVVNRGKQGRAEDTVTLSSDTPPPPKPTTSSPHIHIHTLLSSPHSTSCGPTHILASPCFKLCQLMSHIPNDLSVWWTGLAITHFSLFLLLLSLCLTSYLLFSPFVFTFFCPFSPQTLRLLW